MGRFLSWLRGRQPAAGEPRGRADHEPDVGSTRYGSSPPRQAPIVVRISKPRCTRSTPVAVEARQKSAWDSLFSTPKRPLPGFAWRSRRRVRLHFGTDHGAVLEANRTLYVVTDLDGAREVAEFGVPEGLTTVAATLNGALLRADTTFGFLDFQTGVLSPVHFDWQPLSHAVGAGRWFVGTRESYSGPGELYCFSSGGDLLWAVEFREAFDSPYGRITATPYHVRVLADGASVVVSTMDLVYRLDPEGSLRSRVDLTSLHRSRRHGGTAQSPAASLATGLTVSVGVVSSPHQPIVALEYDAETDQVFLLEATGRVTAADGEGRPVWTYDLGDPAQRGQFLGWTGDALVLSCASGYTVWLDRQGAQLTNVRLPATAVAVSRIPDEQRYLIACADDRRYEFDPATVDLRQGPAANREMCVFHSGGCLVFYDGYLWVAPPGTAWQPYVPREADHGVEAAALPEDQPAPQVKPGRQFRQLWAYRDPRGRVIGHYVVDPTRKRLYVARQKHPLSAREEQQEYDAVARGKSACFWHEVVCFDFAALTQRWTRAYQTDVTMLETTPDGEALFVGLWVDGLATDPAKLVVLSDAGRQVASFDTRSNPTRLAFSDAGHGVLEVFEGPGYTATRTGPQGWDLSPRPSVPAAESEGGGQSPAELAVGDYHLRRLDRRRYAIACGDASKEPRVSATVYDAVLLPDSVGIVLRIGSKTLRALNPALEQLWEIKMPGSVSSMVQGPKGILAVGSQEVVYVTPDGRLLWRLGALPNTRVSAATWLPTRQAFLWRGGDRHYYQVSLLSLAGDVGRSQIFEDVHPYRDLVVSDDESSFVMARASSIECYTLTG
jgi:hypothetical protein